MKKYIAIFLLLTAAVGGILIYDCIYYHRQISLETFDVSKYESVISSFPYSDIFDSVSFELGPIDNADTAKKKAESFWISVFGEDIKGQKPYYCFYDDEAGVWHITTKKAFRHIWEKNRKGGGTAHLIVRSDGKVLASWLSR